MSIFGKEFAVLEKSLRFFGLQKKVCGFGVKKVCGSEIEPPFLFFIKNDYCQTRYPTDQRLATITGGNQHMTVPDGYPSKTKV